MNFKTATLAVIIFTAINLQRINGMVKPNSTSKFMTYSQCITTVMYANQSDEDYNRCDQFLPGF